MKILALIPARGGSKGIPKKNIKKLGGKELIRYSIELGLACTMIDQVVVSTDDEAIADVSRQAGASVPFLRPAALADDRSPTIDTVIHALQFFEAKGQIFDAVCLLQATSPFRTQEELHSAIQQFEQKQADSLISVREVPHVYNPHWVFKPTEDGQFLKIATGEETIISRRQDLPKAFHRDGAIYISKKEVILKERSLYGRKVAHYLMTDSPNINIDSMEDWKLAEQEIAKRQA